MEILQRILVQLNEKKLKQKEFCAAIGIPEKTFSTWKSRNTNPPADKLPSIADFLGITIEELVTGFEKPLAPVLLPDEHELLFNYQKLDSRGKHRLHTLAYEELDRMDMEDNQCAPPSSKESVG